MNWNLLQQFNPYEQWQFSAPIASNVEYFKFEWTTPNTPKLRNYIAQSDDDFNLFEIKKMISSNEKSSIFYLPCPSIWIERKIGILCPKIWAAAVPEYKVNLYVWQE